jgi:vacuolar protein sorting-associated protein 13A/C
VDKQVLKEIHLKRSQKYNEEDYRRLESLMYDKFFLRLESAQVPFWCCLSSFITSLTLGLVCHRR